MWGQERALSPGVPVKPVMWHSDDDDDEYEDDLQQEEVQRQKQWRK